MTNQKLLVDYGRLLQCTVDLLQLDFALVRRQLPLGGQVTDDTVKFAGLLLSTHTQQLTAEVTQSVQLRSQ